MVMPTVGVAYLWAWLICGRDLSVGVAYLWVCEVGVPFLNFSHFRLLHYTTELQISRSVRLYSQYSKSVQNSDLANPYFRGVWWHASLE